MWPRGEVAGTRLPAARRLVLANPDLHEHRLETGQSVISRWITAAIGQKSFQSRDSIHFRGLKNDTRILLATYVGPRLKDTVLRALGVIF